MIINNFNNFNDYIKESLRNKMIPKSEDEIRTNIKKSLNVNNDIISVKIWNPYKYKLVSDTSLLKEEEYNNDYYKVTGDIVDIFVFITIYTMGSNNDVDTYIKTHLIED